MRKSERIVKMYDEGHAINDIARAVSVSHDYVRDLLRMAGRNCFKRPLDVGKVKALLRAGWSVEKITGEFNWMYSPQEIVDAVRGETNGTK